MGNPFYPTSPMDMVIEWVSPYLPSNGVVATLSLLVVLYHAGILHIGRRPVPSADLSIFDEAMEANAKKRRHLQGMQRNEKLKQQDRIARARERGVPDPVESLRPSEEELAQQKVACAAVRERAMKPAKLIKEKFRELDATEELLEALTTLKKIYTEQGDLGHVGVIATTELCNTLLAADALDGLQSLQGHEDVHVSVAACFLFQRVIPRIWSF